MGFWFYITFFVAIATLLVNAILDVLNPRNVFLIWLTFFIPFVRCIQSIVTNSPYVGGIFSLYDFTYMIGIYIILLVCTFYRLIGGADIIAILTLTLSFSIYDNLIVFTLFSFSFTLFHLFFTRRKLKTVEDMLLGRTVPALPCLCVSVGVLLPIKHLIFGGSL